MIPLIVFWKLLDPPDCATTAPAGLASIAHGPDSVGDIWTKDGGMDCTHKRAEGHTNTQKVNTQSGECLLLWCAGKLAVLLFSETPPYL